MIIPISPGNQHFTLLGMILSDPDVVPNVSDRFLTLGGLHDLCVDFEHGTTIGVLVCIDESLGVFFAEPGDIADEYIVHAYFQRGAWGRGIVEAQNRAAAHFANMGLTNVLISYVPTFNRVAHIFNMRCGFKDIGVIDEGRFLKNGESIPCWKMRKEL